MGSGRSHFRERHLAGPQAVHNSVAAVADAAEVVGVAVAADVVVDAAVAVGGPEQQQADCMPGRCSSTTGCIVLHSSFDLRISDIDS